MLFAGLAARSYEDFYARSIAVLKPPGGNDERAQRQRQYLDSYYGGMRVRVYWGTPESSQQNYASAGTNLRQIRAPLEVLGNHR